LTSNQLLIEPTVDEYNVLPSTV